MNPSNNKKITAVSLGILMTLLLAVFVCWASFQPQALESVKEITVTVNHSEDFIPLSKNEDTWEDDEDAEDDEPFVLEIETTAKTLAAALEPYELLELLEEPDSVFIAAADGEYADYSRGQTWICYFEGKPLEDTVDVHPIQDGDSYYFYLITE